MNNKFLLNSIITIVVGVGLVVIFKFLITKILFAPTASNINAGITRDKIFTTTSSPSFTETETPTQPIQVVVADLDIPWEMVFLPDNSLLITQRPGTLVRIFPNNKESIPIEGVVHVGEGGLQGLALHPEFSQNQLIYLYLTTREDDRLINRVERYYFDLNENQLSEKQVILDYIPGATFHDGGRIKFGPDGLLYVTTGDAGQAQLAQEINSLAGKILRLTPDGDPPADNPFNNLVYSYGHRNVQGIAWDSQGRLWATEHGPSGIETGNDEINMIVMGSNYGWPVIKGKQQQAGMQAPIIESGASETWAPTGMEIIEDNLFFTGLRGETLYHLTMADAQLGEMKAHFRKEYGRLRFVRLGPDGWLYIATNNTDGRGTPRANDDKIIKIHPSVFEL